MQGVATAERSARVDRMLDLVHLTDFAERLPSQLSGGQQQRVALARALAPQPRVLLLDEPLSALDLKLRQAMRVELKQLQETTGITFVFVTHDQEEALTMSDRIAVMSAGEVQQVGSPRDIYETPVKRFVADFIGETNLLPSRSTRLPPQGRRGSCCRVGTPSMSLLPRPHRAHASRLGPARAHRGCRRLEGVPARVERVIYLGTDLQLLARLADGTPVTVRLQNSDRAELPPQGAEIGLVFEPGAMRLLAD